MNEYSEDRENERLDEALRGLGDYVHVPAEVILAYAEGRLALRRRESIAAHLERCHACEDILTLARKLMLSTGAPIGGDASQGEAVPRAVASKARLIAQLSGSKNEVVDGIARMLLPQDLWFAVRPTIKAVRDWRRSPHLETDQGAVECAVAAFASSDNAHGKETVETIIKVVDFVDELYLYLSMRCGDVTDIPERLRACIRDAAFSIDAGPLRDVNTDDIRLLVLGRFAGDADQ